MHPALVVLGALAGLALLGSAGRPAAAVAAVAGALRGVPLRRYPGAATDGNVTTNPRTGVRTTHRTPPGVRVVTERSPSRVGVTMCAWKRGVYALLTGAPFNLSAVAALLFLAHLTRETGSGWYCWCNNFGNVKALYWSGPWFRLSDGEAYRAYPDPVTGMQACIAFIQTQNGGRYIPAWRKLVAGDVTWYGDLGRLGYYEGDPVAAQADYEAILRDVRACVTGRST